ncbi:hypothetical protein DL96DRAFT_1532733 [Flagelloscypha sp. PMI_526]|nr:hypothetical protein DL96DRAFT_1532733 [Flagelloscypha sp. PMI_526]
MTSTTKLTYLVFGATGNQGGATVAALLNKVPASSIRIVTRNPASASAQRLASKGVHVFQGDLSSFTSLAPALQGVTALHLVTDYKDGGEVEVAQAKNAIEGAKTHGVQHIVFSSVDGEGSGVPHWESKFKIEKMLKETDIQWTILRPVTFMDNFPVNPGMARAATLGFFNSALGGKKVQLVATNDIGWFAAEAMTSPQEYQGKILSLVGDYLSVGEMTKAYHAIQGGQAWKLWIPQTVVYGILPGNIGAMTKFIRGRPPGSNIDELRKHHSGLLNFESWVKFKTEK